MPFEKQLNEETKFVTRAVGEPPIQDLKLRMKIIPLLVLSFQINSQLLIEKNNLFLFSKSQDQYIQLERRGYFKVDKIHEEGGKKVPELIFVPDGKSKGMSTITKNVNKLSSFLFSKRQVNVIPFEIKQVANK